MEKTFFIMMYLETVSGTKAMPLVGADDEVLFCDSLESARLVAEGHHACQAFGYEIFQMGNGE